MASVRTIPVAKITVSQRQLDEIAVEVAGIKNGVERVIVGALNKTAAKGRTSIVDDLKNVTTVKRNNIFKRTRIIKAHKGHLVALIQILGRRIGAVNFKHRIVNRMRKRRKYGISFPGEGVYVQEYQGGPEIRFPHGFKAKGKPSKEDPTSGNVHIFERIRQGGKIGTREGRYPWWPKMGLSLHKVYRDHPEMSKRGAEAVEAALGTELRSQVDRLLKRKKSF